MQFMGQILFCLAVWQPSFLSNFKKMKKILFIACLFTSSSVIHAQPIDSSKSPVINTDNTKNALKFNLNPDGSHYFQVTFLNQLWLRYNESNPGTTQFSAMAPSTFDIGLRRTRIQMFGQITDRTFIYFQFGQNNFNNTAGYPSGNRKLAAFFHDALCEYKASKGKQLIIGAGLTIMNGLSRFSQPSIATIMTMDVPVFLQYTVDQTDQFARRLAIYARGQIKRLDYRLCISNPFPINSFGSTAPTLSKNASFVNFTAIPNGQGPGINNQFGAYLAYNFFENEGHTTPYMTGTYLGAKKVCNIAIGGISQKNATWFLSQDNTGAYNDTSFANMTHLSIESFLDMPLNKEKNTALSAFIGYYLTNYGKNYLRYNGLMNPATGSTATNLLQSAAYGNAFPMFGTGHVVYAQFGYLLPKKLLGEKNGQLMPYMSGQFAKYDALQNNAMLVFNAGANWLIKGHNSKISLDYQNRPTYYEFGTNKDVKSGPRKSCIVLQYQIFI